MNEPLSILYEPQHGQPCALSGGVGAVFGGNSSNAKHRFTSSVVPSIQHDLCGYSERTLWIGAEI